MPTYDLSPFADTSCLVTGGLGFIGSNLAIALRNAGASVCIVDGLIPGHGGNYRNIEGAPPAELVIAELDDTASLTPAMTQAQYVFNIAGQVSHTESMENPLGDLDLNARQQLAFLEHLRRVNPDAIIVHTSTRQVYGRPRYLPVDETHPVHPVDVNGINKYAGEQFHLLYANVYGLAASVLRLTNVYGPRQRLSDDRLGFIPSFIRRAIEDQPITVYGDGSQLRDCVHVDDVIDACAAAALTADSQGRVFNLGHPEPLSLRAIADTIVDAAGSGSVQLVPWPTQRKSIDIGDYYGDFAKAKRILGWEPRINFREGISATLAFYMEHLAWYL